MRRVNDPSVLVDWREAKEISLFQKNNADIEAKLQGVLGKKAWGVNHGIGTFVTREFGRSVPPQYPYEKTHGEWHLWVYGGAWRLERGRKMRLSDLAKTYDLHDSSVEDIHSFSDSNKLIIDLTLCNWRQAFYKEGEPEIVLGKLKFANVSFFNLWSKQKSCGQNEILNVIIINNAKNVKSEKIRINLLCIDLSRSVNEVESIEIEADDILWDTI